MIKINEIEILKLINNGDLNAIKNYIDNEILIQVKTDVLVWLDAELKKREVKNEEKGGAKK